MNTTHWILDTGFTIHVRPHKHSFTNYKPITPILVNLPTSHTVSTTHAGNIIILDHITLYNVIHIPEFHLNLISVKCLTVNRFLLLWLSYPGLPFQENDWNC